MRMNLGKDMRSEERYRQGMTKMKKKLHSSRKE